MGISKTEEHAFVKLLSRIWYQVMKQTGVEQWHCFSWPSIAVINTMTKGAWRGKSFMWHTDGSSSPRKARAGTPVRNKGGRWGGQPLTRKGGGRLLAGLFLIFFFLYNIGWPPRDGSTHRRLVPPIPTINQENAHGFFYWSVAGAFINWGSFFPGDSSLCWQKMNQPGI